jgi:5-methyltetrahydrofolate--homocysteine methyltransferase
VVYVPDASRAVGVATKLLSVDQRDGYMAEIVAEYKAVRSEHASRKGATMVTLEEARANRFTWNEPFSPTIPNQLGLQTLNPSLGDLALLIDWTPFFQSWDLAGRYPAILDNETVGETARQLFADAKKMLTSIINENWLSARAVFGLYPASAENEDIIIYADEERTTELTRWVGLRQQHKQPKGRYNMALADFVGERDYVGAFAVTAGHRIEERVAAFEAANDDYSAIMLKSLADRLAEAAAEWLHLQIRTQYWGYANDEALTNNELINEQYKGIRPAPGYPACPDHTAKRELFALLDAPANAGMLLTESCAMMPAAAVSGFYIGHPGAAYFAIPKIGRDQLEDWACAQRHDDQGCRILAGPVALIDRWAAVLTAAHRYARSKQAAGWRTPNARHDQGKLPCWQKSGRWRCLASNQAPADPVEQGQPQYCSAICNCIAY